MDPLSKHERPDSVDAVLRTCFWSDSGNCVSGDAKVQNKCQVRFDAFQSLYLFVAFLVVSTVLPPFLWLSFHTKAIFLLVGPLKMAIFVVWIYLLVKAAQEQQVHLPVIGDLAARSAAEQL